MNLYDDLRSVIDVNSSDTVIYPEVVDVRRVDTLFSTLHLASRLMVPTQSFEPDVLAAKDMQRTAIPMTTYEEVRRRFNSYVAVWSQRSTHDPREVQPIVVPAVEQCVIDYPWSPEMWHALGLMHARCGHHRKALGAFARTVALCQFSGGKEPSRLRLSQLHCDIAEALMRSGRLDAAREQALVARQHILRSALSVVDAIAGQKRRRAAARADDGADAAAADGTDDSSEDDGDDDDGAPGGTAAIGQHPVADEIVRCDLLQHEIDRCMSDYDALLRFLQERQWQRCMTLAEDLIHRNGASSAFVFFCGAVAAAECRRTDLALRFVSSAGIISPYLPPSPPTDFPTYPVFSAAGPVELLAERVVAALVAAALVLGDGAIPPRITPLAQPGDANRSVASAALAALGSIVVMARHGVAPGAAAPPVVEGPLVCALAALRLPPLMCPHDDCDVQRCGPSLEAITAAWLDIASEDGVDVPGLRRAVALAACGFLTMASSDLRVTHLVSRHPPYIIVRGPSASEAFAATIASRFVAPPAAPPPPTVAKGGLRRSRAPSPFPLPTATYPPEDAPVPPRGIVQKVYSVVNKMVMTPSVLCFPRELSDTTVDISRESYRTAIGRVAEEQLAALRSDGVV